MKHMIVIIDGTQVSAADRDTPFSNAYNLNWLLDNRAQDGNAQIVLYSSGIGSDKSAQALLDRATAQGIDQQTREAYINICSNFKRTDAEGKSDKLYLFGFSRGAIVARALSGIISSFGVLRPNMMNYFPDVWDRFVNGRQIIGKQLSNVLHRDVDIEMVGLFDCVFGNRNRSGKFYTLQFKDFRVADRVRAAVHLLSLDDRRVLFEPMLWEANGEHQILEQIWMPGVHSDIGGTYRANKLGRVALRTMIDRIKAHTELKFDEDSIKNLRLSEEPCTVNDEGARWYNVGRWRSVRRQFSKERGEYLHPVADEVVNLDNVKYKGRWRPYQMHASFDAGTCPRFDEFHEQHDWSSYIL